MKRARTFSLPAQPPVAAPAPVRGYRPRTLSRAESALAVSERVLARQPQPAARTDKAETGQPRKATVLSFIVASERKLPGMFGPMRLACSRSAVNLERLHAGLLPLALDHDTTQLLGRVTSIDVRQKVVYGEAKVMDSPLSRTALAEMRFGARRGFSPGFIINEVSMSREDAEDVFDVVSWTPYEVSSTPTPRGLDAKLVSIRRASMTTFNEAPELLTTADLDGLSLAIGRAVLRDGKASRKQLDRLAAFYAHFDEALSTGRGREESIAVAKVAAGLAK